MAKFLVRLSGENLQIEIEERNWIFWKSAHLIKAGFYTTRFVEAKNANEAMGKITDIVREELQQTGHLTDESTIKVDQIKEDEKAFDLDYPDGGYTFFTQD